MKWKAKSFALSAALVLGLAGPALAATTTQWTGNGSENLPCSDGGHWVLSPAQGITSAVLTINGVAYTMQQNGQGSWSADSAGALDAETSATATYEGDNETAFLKLSHCVESSESPTPTPTPTESPSPTDSPTPTESPSPSESTTPPPTSPPTSSHTSTPPTRPTHTGSSSHTPSQPSTPPIAETGFDKVDAAVAAFLLLFTGLFLLWAARRNTQD